jgi:hypothetical protein
LELSLLLLVLLLLLLLLLLLEMLSRQRWNIAPFLELSCSVPAPSPAFVS